MPRRQLPAYSPLAASAVMRSTLARNPAAGTELVGRIQRHLGVEDALLCGSGTQALQLALTASGDATAPVALPAFSCYDVASAAIGAGRPVRFYDIDPRTLAPDMVDLDDALGDGCRTVVLAPFAGYQPDWADVRRLAADREVTVIEDAAQAFGSSWRARPAGSLGDLSVLSFGRGKGWTATRGGAVLGGSDRLARVRDGLTGRPSGGRWSVLARGLGQWTLGRPGAYWIPQVLPGLSLGETVFHPPVAPSGLGDSVADLAVRTLDAALDETAFRRRRAADLMTRLAEAAPDLRVPRPIEGSEPGYLRLPVLPPPGSTLRTDRRAQALGIMPSYPRPLHSLPQVGHLVVNAGGTFPGARELAERMVTLPTHSLVSEAEVTRIIECVLRGDVD